MKKVFLDDFIEERIEENKDLFSNDELDLIRKNKKCVNKIYLLGVVNARECYEKDFKKAE